MNELSTNTTPKDVFREKIAERVRRDIGDLMPDEMLQEIVRQAITAEIQAPTGPSHDRQPWLQREIRETIGAQVKEEARQQILVKRTEMQTILANEIRERLPEMMAAVFMAILTNQRFEIDNLVTDVLNRMRSSVY